MNEVNNANFTSLKTGDRIVEIANGEARYWEFPMVSLILLIVLSLFIKPFGEWGTRKYSLQDTKTKRKERNDNGFRNNNVFPCRSVLSMVGENFLSRRYRETVVEDCRHLPMAAVHGSVYRFDTGIDGMGYATVNKINNKNNQ